MQTEQCLNYRCIVGCRNHRVSSREESTKEYKTNTVGLRLFKRIVKQDSFNKSMLAVQYLKYQIEEK